MKISHKIHQDSVEIFKSGKIKLQEENFVDQVQISFSVITHQDHTIAQVKFKEISSKFISQEKIFQVEVEKTTDQVSLIF